MYGKDKNDVGRPVLIDSERKVVVSSTWAEAVLEGNCYSYAAQTGTVWSVGLHQTNTGVCVANPIGSGKDLSILAAGYSEIVAPAGIADAWIATGYHASTNVALGVIGVATNLLVGGGIGVANVYSGASLPAAPVYNFPIMTGHTDNALSVSAAPGLIRIDGLVVLPPGGFAIIANFTIGETAGAKGAILWQELDN
jgi:hypothetical protein